MNLVHVTGAQHTAFRAGRPIGPIVTPLCEGPNCTNRTAPVFLVVGKQRACLLCASCRTWRNVVIHAALSEIRRSR